MNRALLSLLPTMICCVWLTAGACEVDSAAVAVREAVIESRCGLWQLADLAFENPAVNQWRMTNGYTNVGTSYICRKDKNNPDLRDGSGDSYWQLGASTYTKYRTSTLWGHASYINGKTTDVVWNETADKDLLYPYLLADSMGGDLKMERYCFSGGYADHNEKWAWGAKMSYDATLQYRDVDPRPRNVVGRLEVSAGAMMRLIGVYHVGVAFNLLKYKQTNDIDFKSEMGVDKIFHLTGMATHYNRFAGNGLSTYYDGYRYGVDLNLYPADNKGFFATVRLSRLTFKNILSDMNKLPLASVWHNQLSAQAGWFSGVGDMFGGVSAQVEVFRRHGKENIFGDATSSVYPVIASNEMFADNEVSVTANGRWGMCFGPVNRFYIDVIPEWMHKTTAYVEPYNYKELNKCAVTVKATGVVSLGKRCMLDAGVSVMSTQPYKCSLNIIDTDPELRGLTAAERGEYIVESGRASEFAAAIAATCNISGRYALKCGCNLTYINYNAGMTRNKLDFILSFIF